MKKSDKFTAHGYYSVSNCGGYEVELSNDGEAARLRCTVTGRVTRWMEIQYIEDPSNGETVSIISPRRYRIPLSEVMRIM